jgi:L-2-hydroxyglutarate oxidase LhgO
MTEHVDCIVIGAGVVGLAVARELALGGREVIVLERNDRIGAETSSRNSEVIHAGIYYASGSLKAQLSVAGRPKLYRYCEQRSIDHQRTGKLIVAIDEQQIGKLALIAKQARINGVLDLEDVTAARLRELEPEVLGTAALLSPSTGIIDSHSLMQSLEADLESNGGIVALESQVRSLALQADGICIEVEAQGTHTELSANLVINAAGLNSIEVARGVSGDPRFEVPAPYYAKGSYFSYQGRSPFRHLVYPIPETGGLGIHATLDLAGRLRFGPDVEWVETPDYTVDRSRADAFYTAIRTYWPELPDNSLEPDYAGVRPKLVGPGQTAADFRIEVRNSGGRARLVHLLGFESPGLTACLAIGEAVRGALAG